MLTGLQIKTAPTERNRRSFAKAVSWRLLGTLDTFVIGVVVSGSFKVAGSIAGLEVLTKTVLYYFHERVWARIPWARF
jgi:uncharacterized membrane protein